MAVVLDLFSRRVVGWAVAARQDESLIEAAFRIALLGRRPGIGLLFEYTEYFYHRVRRHSSLANKGPVVCEQLMC